MSILLPGEFSALEHLVPEWAIEDGHTRYVKRVNSTMTEIQAFYDAVFQHAEAAVAYLNEFDYQKPLPEDAANLRNLLYSLITVSLAVEPRTRTPLPTACRSVSHSVRATVPALPGSPLHGVLLASRAALPRRPHGGRVGGPLAAR